MSPATERTCLPTDFPSAFALTAFLKAMWVGCYFVTAWTVKAAAAFQGEPPFAPILCRSLLATRCRSLIAAIGRGEGAGKPLKGGMVRIEPLQALPLRHRFVFQSEGGVKG
jgi:hypothetical protein